jgi:hypothetical protein
MKKHARETQRAENRERPTGKENKKKRNIALQEKIIIRNLFGI